LSARTRREAIDAAPRDGRHGARPVVGLFAVLALTLGAPLGYGASMLSSPRAVADAFRVFGPEWASSLELAGAVTAIVFVSTLSVGGLTPRGPGRLARFGWLAAAVAAAAAPAAVIGVAVIELFNAAGPLRTVHDATPMAWWLASVTRVAFVGLLAAAAGGGPAEVGVEELARADGLTGWERAWHVRWPMRWPALLAASVAAGLISMSEVAVSTLVRPPGVGVIAVSLLNQMHFGRQDAVIASSLLTLVPATIAAIMLAVALRARRGEQ
jgi:ABC-type Fe3+ transport system permease subunit